MKMDALSWNCKYQIGKYSYMLWDNMRDNINGKKNKIINSHTFMKLTITDYFLSVVGRPLTIYLTVILYLYY